MIKFERLVPSGSFFMVTLMILVFSTSCAKDPEDPEPEFTYAGNYNGFWKTTVNGTTTVSDQVSATFTEPAENIFVGTFYYSNNWNPCCGPQHDGEISFTLETDSLKSLIFNQDFRTFGFQFLSCPATFAGEGIINEDGNLAFKLSGSDCIGSHIGTLLLRKQE